MSAQDTINVIDLETISVSSTRASGKSPFTFVNTSNEELNATASAVQMPMLLNLMPSVVATTENGTGSGNTSMRIRGVDASRINVSINGLPLNNPESQEVFWVNLPKLSSAVQSVQLQRGVGTSTNGTSAFGGSLNMQTNKISVKPSAELSTSIASYNTLSTTASASTGLIKGFFADVQYSYLNTDGYIRNGFSNQHSLFATSGYSDNKNLVKVIYIFGKQRTGITWEGATMEDLEKDWRYNPSGAYYDDAGNLHYYDNETDNYTSHILQAFYNRKINDNLNFNLGFNYTKGYGYYENYKYDTKFSKFGLGNQEIDEIMYKKSDFVRQKAMNNDFFAGNFNINYNKNNFNFDFGGMYSYYMGHHFGVLPYIKHRGNIAENFEYYRNKGIKQDWNVYAKASYLIAAKVNLYADVQYRNVNYRLSGISDDLFDLNYRQTFNFINPKIGVNYDITQYHAVYLSGALGMREPTRSDIKENLQVSNPNPLRPENLYDIELGYRLNYNKIHFLANLYFMYYKDQLVPNGKLSDSGYKLMSNVDKSLRAGIELALSAELTKWFALDLNLTLSQNKILDFDDEVMIYDNPEDWGEVGYNVNHYKSTDLAFSPNIIAAVQLKFTPFSNFNINLTGKYVGSQYYDNYSTPDNKLTDYFVANANISYKYIFYKNYFMKFDFFVNNFTNNHYFGNAWVYDAYFATGDKVTDKGFFAQAPINFECRMTIGLN
ncbi:TonB-dependent receptor [Bacteroidia bacterium]|nr:TonB-dependent receptor [Bacteroidia bacterium]